MLCSFASCGRPAVRNGLCHAHSQQQARGRPLAPIRERPAKPMTSVSIRLPSDVCLAVGQDLGGARTALAKWARKVKRT